MPTFGYNRELVREQAKHFKQFKQMFTEGNKFVFKDGRTGIILNVWAHDAAYDVPLIYFGIDGELIKTGKRLKKQSLTPSSFMNQVERKVD